MTAGTRPRTAPGDPALAARLRDAVAGEVLFDPFSRGRYATDASIYQVEPLGVVVPRSVADVEATLAVAREHGVPVLPRGGGTSQCGQTVAEAVVIDCSKHLNQVIHCDPQARTVTVQPGLVLDQLNAYLRPHGLFFPIDPSTASRATLGGMVGNNSCGSRSIRYGNTVHNVYAVDAILASGEHARFAETPADLAGLDASPAYKELVQKLRGIAAREADEIAARWPRLLRHVAGYNLNTLSADGHNMARMLVGSEGTLAFFTSIELDLQPIPRHRVLGVCHFPTFYQAMDSTRHLVELAPAAVELVDRTMIDLSRDIPAFRPTIERFVKGAPDALLLVEFAGEELDSQLADLKRLGERMASLGFPDSVAEIVAPADQKALWEVRKAGLNIMMSMKGDGKPVSFIEDCAVPLEDLAEYTDRLTRVFEKHGTRGTWYAHASVGCLHVRPVLNMKDGGDVAKMRAIAEEAFAMVREYKGSHSGEHGDGIVRSEFHEPMLGSRIVRALEEVKDAFDPDGLFNPGRIVRPPKMDDRRLFRYRPDYAPLPVATALDWSEWHGLAGAVEMCNNNGACRKREPGVMCPSFRATGDEQHLTRGRANTLRLALTGQLGPGALTAPGMREALSLCVSCKGCKRECPTGVDMARMKIEVLAQVRRERGPSLRERLFAYLPRYAPYAWYLGPLLNRLQDRAPAARLREWLLALSARRRLPRWDPQPFSDRYAASQPVAGDGRDVVLLADTFNTWFEPHNARAALAVLRAAGYRVHLPRSWDGDRPLCCGRTFLSAGLVRETLREAWRTLDALEPYLNAGVPVVGLEPSCLLTFRDEYGVLTREPRARKLADQALLFEEFLVREADAGRLHLPLEPRPGRRALLHGHCHQKAHGVMGAVERALRLIPELEVELLEGTCCGMAGTFGYEAEHYDVSLRIGELDVLPGVRARPEDTWVVADGTSCRQQIGEGTGRAPRHVAAVLHEALAGREPPASSG